MANLANERSKSIEQLIGAVDKAFGKGALMQMGANVSPIRTETIAPTGALSLDLACGIEGIPKGRVIEIYGPEASGKTTLTLQMAAEVQKAGKVVAFVDAEHALDMHYAEKIGVDFGNLLVAQPDSGEQALQIVQMLVESNSVDLVIVDSVAALTPKAEIEGSMGDSHVGLHARLMSQAMRKLTPAIAKSGCTVIFINQLRMKIGVMFGSPETTTGGNALKFYASLRFDIRRIASIKQGDQVLGNRVRIKVVKNKLAAPFREAELDLMFGKGVSKYADILDLGINHNFVSKNGSWFSYGDLRLGQGRDAAKTYLEENPLVTQEIERKLRATFGFSHGDEKAAEIEPKIKEKPARKGA